MSFDRRKNGWGILPDSTRLRCWYVGADLWPSSRSAYRTYGSGRLSGNVKDSDGVRNAGYNSIPQFLPGMPDDLPEYGGLSL